RVIVPRGIDPLRVLQENKISILKKYHKLISQVETARDKTLIKWPAAQFEAIVASYVDRYSRQLQVRAKEIKFRKMRRRWGSCRSDGIITFNRYLQFVPEKLIAYIVYHELTHLIVRGHNQRFKKVIALEFPNYRVLDKELNLYGLKLLT
ncbi:MAG TPA: M48 family metallopeptidase, partial [Candidatus Kapabacteria bacterium]|nr:M48 family metallopeptidase [Candidatus Kapabacteria bacterium]